jgi:hypothetical protein
MPLARGHTVLGHMPRNGPLHPYFMMPSAVTVAIGRDRKQEVEMASLPRRLRAGLLSGLLLMQLAPFGMAQTPPPTGSPERAVAEPSAAQVSTPPRPDASREPRRNQPGAAAQPDRSIAQDAPDLRLPAAVTSRHMLTLPEHTLRFSATAGSIRLADPQGARRPILLSSPIMSRRNHPR